MIRAIRTRRALLAGFGGPVSAVHVLVLVLAVFMHPFEHEAWTGRAAAEDFTHAHDFRLLDDDGRAVVPPLHCPGCTVERNPALPLFTGRLSSSTSAGATQLELCAAFLPETLASPFRSRAPPRS